MEIKKRVKLTGQELEEFRRRKDKERHYKWAIRLSYLGRVAISTLFFRNLGAAEALIEDDDSSSDEEMDVGKNLHGAKAVRHDIIMKGANENLEPNQQIPQKKGFFKSSKTK